MDELELQNEQSSRTQVPSVMETVVAAPKAEPIVAPQNNLDITNMRAKAINCLGYLNRYKAQNPAATSQLQMLEKELRELRAIIDPVEPVPNKTPTQQPSFNPLHLDPISSDFDVQSLLTSIRKPKREKHESQKV